MLFVLGWSLGQTLDSHAESSKKGGTTTPPGSGPATEAPESLGSIDKELLRDAIKQHTDEVRYCYEKRLADNPSLEGRLVVAFKLDPAGKVSWATKKESSLDDEEVETCIVKAVQRWTLPKPEGGAVLVSYPFVFKSTASLFPAKLQPLDVRLFGASGRAVIRSRRPELSACYNAALSANPDLQGRIGCRFVVADEGIVKDVSVTSSNIAADEDRGLSQCLLAKARTWRFPQLAPGSYVHTFVFGAEYDLDATLVPFPAGPPAQVLSRGELVAAKRSGADPVLPYAVRAKHLCGTIESRFKVCVEPSGVVSSVNLVLGIPGANRAVVDELRIWRFALQPTASCYEQTLVFKIGSVTECPQGHTEPTLAQTTPPAKLVPAAWMIPERLTSPIPHLQDFSKVKFVCQTISATYRMCVDQDGTVYSVDPVQGIPNADASIRETLLRWRFKPRRIPACYLEDFTYQIDGNDGCAAVPAGQR